MTPPKEITLKQWLADEAERLKMSVMGVHSRLQRGKYPGLKIRRVNKRVVWVTEKTPDERKQL